MTMQDYYKYPRTLHLPWSLGSTSDDKFHENTDAFRGKTIVVTEKMDGENTNMYPDRYHARSIDSRDHPSRSYAKKVWGEIRHQIPTGWRICGENVYAEHSLPYDDLDAYFMVFSIWDENNMRLAWNDIVDITKSLNLITVPVIDIIVYDEDYLKNLANTMDLTKKEGYVIQNVEPFHFDDFTDNAAKFVRPKHITTDQHWMEKPVVPNKLKNEHRRY